MRIDRYFCQLPIFVCLAMLTRNGFAEEFPVQMHDVRETENFIVDLEIGHDDYRSGGQLLLLIKMKNGSVRKFNLNRTRASWPSGHKAKIEVTVTPAIMYNDAASWGFEWHGSQGDALQEQDDVAIKSVLVTSTATKSSRAKYLGKVTVLKYPSSTRLADGSVGSQGDLSPIELQNDMTKWVSGLSPTVVVNAICGSDADCGDSRFCNGAEMCRPADPLADARGCVRGLLPCGAGQNCDEPAQRCDMPCTDNDGDGHYAIHCGGDDCDDTDARRFPGNVEIQDANDHDEDCDVNTHGFFRGAMSQQICDGRDKVVLVDASERFTRARCVTGTVCVQQPNGEGVCMTEPPHYQAPTSAILPSGPQAAPPATLQINRPASTSNPAIIAPKTKPKKKTGGD